MNSISLAIQDLLDDTEYGLELVLLAGGAGVGHRIHSSRIQKPGLALTGYTEHLHPDRVQVLGNTEISYLRQIAEQQALTHIQKLCGYPISCFIVTKGLDPPAFLKAEVEKAGIPLLVTPHQSSTFISLITKFLEERLLPTTHIHGVLVDVLGVGVLILGKSGIGKSECALDLVIRGHRLVADDVVYVKKKMPAALVGQRGQKIIDAGSRAHPPARRCQWAPTNCARRSSSSVPRSGLKRSASCAPSSSSAGAAPAASGRTAAEAVCASR